jgi:polar amino acid transport system permease protein
MTAVLALLVDGEQWGELLSGLGVSVKVTVLSLLVGLPLGVGLALMVVSRVRAVRWATLGLVEIGRGIPALVLLLFVYYGLPQEGLTLTSTVAAVAALGFSTAAYTSEIFRTSFRAVPRGQREAAASLGLGPFDSFRSVVLPQALRIAVPQLVGFSILVFQGTALCFAIALPELLSKAYQIGSFTFQYLDALVSAALLYAVIAIPLSQLAGFLERRMSMRL